jgi:hypothetical protein
MRTMFKRLALISTALCLLLAVGPAQAKRSVTELVRRADLVARSKTSAAVFEMRIKTRSYQRKLKVVFWDDQRDPKREKTLLKILGPALWRGYGTLKLGSQLKLYNPRSNHVTVVGQSMLGDAWMGSHFTNDDLVKETRLARHYRAKLIKTWTAKVAAGAGGDATHYRISLYPKPTAPVSWGRIDYVLWERGQLVMPVEASYYRKAADKRPRRAMRFSDVTKLGGRLVPAIMTVTVAKKPGEYTKLIYRKVKFDVRIPASKFTEQALRR